MTKPREPNAEIFYKLHEEGHPHAYALKRAGYTCSTPATVRACASKLLTRRSPNVPVGSDHPAVKALDLATLAAWNKLSPQVRAAHLAGIDAGDWIADISGDLPMLKSQSLTGDLAKGGRWDPKRRKRSQE